MCLYTVPVLPENNEVLNNLCKKTENVHATLDSQVAKKAPTGPCGRLRVSNKRDFCSKKARALQRRTKRNIFINKFISSRNINLLTIKGKHVFVILNWELDFLMINGRQAFAIYVLQLDFFSFVFPVCDAFSY